uniref:Uncharacterized protein n=1 Tax=Neolamprologus brichardi TaxID=32507 RepID=A0A3Q4I549_NEOBR
MMNRILFACLFLALSTAGSSLSCRWMDHKFRQHNEETLNLLDTMVSDEDKLAFTVQILEEVAALFEEDHSSASWEDSEVRNLLNIVNKQAEELHSCVSSLSPRDRKFWKLDVRRETRFLLVTCLARRRGHIQDTNSHDSFGRC